MSPAFSGTVKTTVITISHTGYHRDIFMIQLIASFLWLQLSVDVLCRLIKQELQIFASMLFNHTTFSIDSHSRTVEFTRKSILHPGRVHASISNGLNYIELFHCPIDYSGFPFLLIDRDRSQWLVETFNAFQNSFVSNVVLHNIASPMKFRV